MSASDQAGEIETSEALTELRRDLHKHPELRFDVQRTASLVDDRLRASGWTVRTGIAGTGLLATREGRDAGPHVLLRADMDAMPVPDDKDVSYASTVPGVAHACGHDVHTTVLVGVAERLAAAELPRGRVSLVFQPAEEMPYGQASGAASMLAEGIFGGDVPDAMVALHCWPDLAAGSIGVDDRIAMAAKDSFHISLKGVGAHAATPSGGRDAILGISQLVTALHQGIARSLDARDLAAFNVGTLRGGVSQSVVADAAEITGTIRSVEPLVRARLRAVVERVTEGVAAAGGLGHTVNWADSMPAVVNDPRLVRCALEVGRELLGDDRTVPMPTPPMTADDFALFAELAPALYFKLGICGGDSCPPLHSSTFDVDERAIGVGVATMSAIALRLLERPLDSWAGR